MEDKIFLPANVFDFIYAMAVNDATNRVSEPNDKDRILRNEEIKKSVKEYAYKIICGENVNFYDYVKKISSNNINSQEKINEFTFGKIQKIINMTMKYLYIKYYDCPTADFSQCHAPMDSIMRDFVYWSADVKLSKNPEFLRRDTAWSKLEFDQNRVNQPYNEFQDLIKELIDKFDEKLDVKNRIEFDYMFWDKAKSLREKRATEQKDITEKIWDETLKNE